ncbi:MAG: LuxR C-terminal-related transcriptional regulator [Bradyrhizobium sp.]|jgi:DNA-binding CsgD family transcriptional regulator|uniref:helix-turn-helix transcriptional regulator n=2 Tax=Bradyrhizobium sp. TaxID=376 RepID=UPI003C7896DE
MYVTAQESRALSRLFGLLAEDLAEREVRERIGHHLLELLSADQFASFVWDTPSGSFGSGVWLNMSPDNLASYDAYYQFNDPITLKLQARREPTLVSQIMPQRELMRTEFFNDFLARDGLHWGVNVFSYAGGRNIGDLRIWRGRHRENFDLRTLELLRLVEPAFTGALIRAGGAPPRLMPEPAVAPRLSQREFEVAMMICEGLPDKVIAYRLGVETSTIRTYLKRIFDKLGVHRRSGIAAAFARHR